MGKTRGLPFVAKQDFVWSIGIYRGDSPIKLHPSDNVRNPVMRPGMLQTCRLISLKILSLPGESRLGICFLKL